MANAASAILNLFRNPAHGGRAPALPAVALIPQPAQLTPVLLVSTLESDGCFMRDLLDGTTYFLITAARWSEALNLIGHVAVPIILYDRLVDAPGWRPAVQMLLRSWGSPSVVLLSDTLEDLGGDAFIGAAGLEILVRPFDPDEFLRTLDSALDGFSQRAVRSATS